MTVINIDYHDFDFVRVLGRAREGELDDLVRECINDIAGEIKIVAQRLAPKRTGNLVRAIDVTKAVRTGPDTFEAVVGVKRRARHGLWVERGTGIYGPTGNVIRPKTGNYLMFVGDRGPVFTRFVKGQRAQRFLQRAHEMVEATYVPARLEKLAHDMGSLD